MTALSGWWCCAVCGRPTDEPHTGDQDEDLCPECCPQCVLGITDALIDQSLKEGGSLHEVGDRVLFHGVQTAEQAARAEGWMP